MPYDERDRQAAMRRFDDVERGVKTVSNKRTKTRRFWIVTGICLAILVGGVVGTILNPRLVSQFNLFDMFGNKEQSDEPQQIVEVPDPVNVNEPENNLYYVYYDNYYALAFSGLIEGDFDGVWYGYSTPEMLNGVLDEFGNLGYYFSESDEGYYVLNPGVENPEFYLIFKIREENELSKASEYDGVIGAIILRNKNTNDKATYMPDPKIRFIIKEKPQQ